MIDFVSSTVFWIYIGLMFFCQLVNGIGFHGYGAKRDKLMAYGLLGAIFLSIFTCITEGFIAFIAYIVIWFLFTFITTPIVFSFLRWLEVEPRNQNPGEYH